MNNNNHASNHHEHHHNEPVSPEEAVRSLHVLGEVASNATDYESAVEAYASILKIDPNDEIALYNLASFRARGLGGMRDFVEAARLFHQAELLGNERAGKLCGKCLFDYIDNNFAGKSAANLYAEAAVFVSQVYPEARDMRAEAGRALIAVAGTYLNTHKIDEAERTLRAAMEYANSVEAERYLAMLYGEQPEA